MKTKALTFLAGLALVAAARAGTLSTQSAQASSGSLWEWFAGGSAGYLTDMEEGMYGLQVGMEYGNPGGRGTHAIYLEVGFTQDDANFSYISNLPGGRSEEADIDLDIIPITLNYRYEAPLTDRLNWFIGLGVGVAIVDSSYHWSWTQVVAPPGPVEGGGSDDQTDARLYGDIFVGLSYDVTDSFEVFAGVRYILMDEQSRDIDVGGVSDFDEGINGDVLIELGALYHF